MTFEPKDHLAKAQLKEDQEALRELELLNLQLTKGVGKNGAKKAKKAKLAAKAAAKKVAKKVCISVWRHIDNR